MNLRAMAVGMARIKEIEETWIQYSNLLDVGTEKGGVEDNSSLS